MDTSEEDEPSHQHRQQQLLQLQLQLQERMDLSPRRARRRRSNQSDAGGNDSPGASSEPPLSPRPGVRKKDSFGYEADINEPLRQERRRASMSEGEPASSRRSLLTKTDSERRLKETLARVNDYDDDRADRMRDLRERFSSSKRSLSRRRSGSRRSSISSFHSTRSRSSIDSSQGSISLTDPHSMVMTMTDPPSQNLSRNRSSGFLSSELSFDGIGGISRDVSLNVSSSTIPASNHGGAGQGKGEFKKRRDAAKTEQLVESLVWFSFHTPRTVMEDLITHEMEIWRRDNRRLSRSSLNSNNCNNNNNNNNNQSPSTNERPHQHRHANRTQRRPSLDHSTSSNGSLSSLSDEEPPGQAGIFEGDFTESMIRLQGMMSEGDMFKIPKSVNRESALLFVDMSGFTKLSTMLDVESLSKVINSYFDMIVSEVIAHGGDILKFAGDAFFAEWKMDDKSANAHNRHRDSANPLADLNASLASIHEMGLAGDHHPANIPRLATCVLAATKCAMAIVQKYSDYHVTSAANPNGTAAGAANAGNSDAMLNVHCGVGVGRLVGLHVGDYKEDQEEDGVELRREFLILGEPIEQVTSAADVATDGEVFASPEAMMCLRHFCELEKHNPSLPVMIASRTKAILRFKRGLSPGAAFPTALQPYESLRMHCKALNNIALQRLHLQMALYVHPVIRGDELALSQAIQAGKISQPTETLESRHRAEAELRSVYTMFIKAVMTPRITGMQLIDEELYKKLNDIMHVTSRELDRYSGHLRQYIVDDKGVVLIATFGLRGSTFPNMVLNNCLPATFAIHRALQSELKVENRIGATFGKVYCGVVGGVRRHEFAVMGAPVNLAARLMASKENKGILVDEAVKEQVGPRYAFKKLPPVMAKGYDSPVAIYVPLHQVQGSKKKKSVYTFVGRNVEKNAITSVAYKILEAPNKSQSSMVFLMGESGMGKSALAIAVLEQIKQKGSKEKKIVVAARSTSSETEQRIPLSSYRKVFLALVRDHLEQDGNLHQLDESDKRSVTSSRTSFTGLSIRSLHSAMRRGRSAGARVPDSSSVSEEKSTSDRPQLTRGLGVRGQTETLSSRTEHKEHNDSDSMLDQLGQSLRDISEDLLTPETLGKRVMQRGMDGGKKYPAYSYSLNHTTHGIGQLEKTAVHETLTQSLHRISKTDSRRSSMTRSAVATRSPMRGQSLRMGLQQPKPASSVKSDRIYGKGADDSSTTSIDASLHRQATSIPYFEKLCWVCEQLDFPYEYADIVGSQFLGLESASPVTHVDGHVPTMDELVEFLALAFICIADFADLTAVVLDDFQWVDAFSWRIFRVLCKRGKKMLLICATRSHDKQALRRMSTAIARETQLFSQMIEISLGPLDFSEIRELLANVLGYHKDAISENMCGEVFQKTGGLPVYVVQILENIKRTKATELIEGRVEWTEQGKKDKPTMVGNTNSHGAVMEETFLSRFDSLDVRVRKVLQTCAVLGLNFALSDVIQVHPEMEEADIENALETAVDEMILVEQLEEEEDGVSVPSGSLTVDSDSNLPPTITPSRSSDGMRSVDDHYYQFSHAMWRKNVLATMLKERKIELHRLIAESMEKDQVLILEQSDISRLLTLFDHWKSCGDFCKSAPLALAVGARLEEWDLSAQSLELYEDALELAYDSVSTEDTGDSGNNEWIQVKARPVVLDLILRLHICIGLCHQRLSDQYESILFFEDAYNIIKTATKVPGMSKSLMMPIISSLCVLKLEQDAKDSKTRREQEKLVHRFVEEATENGSPVHIGRALGLEATRFASVGEYERALDIVTKLESVYDFEKHSVDMIAEYGRDFGIECFSDSVQWLYLLERHDEAETRADLVINNFLPSLDPANTDDIMLVVLPVIDVLKLVGRAKDADWLLKKYVINPYHDFSTQSDFWAELFNPLAYLLEVITMEETERFDLKVLEELEQWVLQQENTEYSADLERRAHTLMGELCWRLAYFKEEEDPARQMLLTKAGELLTPIARYPHAEVFLKHTAQALLEAL